MNLASVPCLSVRAGILREAFAGSITVNGLHTETQKLELKVGVTDTKSTAIPLAALFRLSMGLGSQ
jgi:hypothetical protein